MSVPYLGVISLLISLLALCINVVQCDKARAKVPAPAPRQPESHPLVFSRYFLGEHCSEDLVQPWAIYEISQIRSDPKIGGAVFWCQSRENAEALMSRLDLEMDKRTAAPADPGEASKLHGGSFVPQVEV